MSYQKETSTQLKLEYLQLLYEIFIKNEPGEKIEDVLVSEPVEILFELMLKELEYQKFKKAEQSLVVLIHRIFSIVAAVLNFHEKITKSIFDSKSLLFSTNTL